jgi:predicted small metal-binding protein
MVFPFELHGSVPKEDKMAVSIACADAGGATCPGSFTTETREELLAHLALHAETAHPEMTMDDATKQHLDRLIKTV